MDGINWVLMILIGGVAGLAASRITKTTHSLTGNVVLGILGAVGMNALLQSALDVHLGGLVGQFITSILGAVGIIAVFQFMRKAGS